ncbi:MAG: DUF427 domain-containing protein [Rhodospirillales bacterium]
MTIRIEPLDKKRTVQITVGGVTAATSNSVIALYEDGYPARFYFPKTDIRMDLLAPSPTRTHCPHKGEADYFSLVLENGERLEDLVWRYADPLETCKAVKNRFAFVTERCGAVYMDGEPHTP